MCCENCCDHYDDDANVSDLENEIIELKDEIKGLEDQLFSDIQPSMVAFIEKMPHDSRCFTEFAGCICVKRFV